MTGFALIMDGMIQYKRSRRNIMDHGGLVGSSVEEALW